MICLIYVHMVAYMDFHGFSCVFIFVHLCSVMLLFFHVFSCIFDMFVLFCICRYILYVIATAEMHVLNRSDTS